MQNFAHIEEGRIWTYEDIQKLDDDNRYEIIDGKLFLLASPNSVHQILIIDLVYQIKNYLKGRNCKVFTAPMDVFLDKKIKKSVKYVQPDIFVVCNKNKIDKRGIYGVPDFIIEILSPGNETKDRLDKLNLYLENKVKEYWIIDPLKGIIETYLYKNKSYIYKPYTITEKIKVNIFEDLFIDISKEFKESEYLLQEESEKYLKEYESLIVDMIYALKDSWIYHDYLKLGRFAEFFQIINGKLRYKF